MDKFINPFMCLRRTRLDARQPGSKFKIGCFLSFQPAFEIINARFDIPDIADQLTIFAGTGLMILTFISPPRRPPERYGAQTAQQSDCRDDQSPKILQNIPP